MSDQSVPPAFAVDGPQPPENIHSYEQCGRLGRHEAHVWLTRRGTWCWGGGEAGKGAAVHPRTAQRQAEQDTVKNAATTAEPDVPTDTGAAAEQPVASDDAATGAPSDPAPAAGRHVAGDPPA